MSRLTEVEERKAMSTEQEISAPDCQPEIVAKIRGSRRTGHGVVTIERGERVRRYRVTLARLYWLRFWLIIRCPWRAGGAWLNGGFDAVLSTRDRDSTPQFRDRQWRDFHRSNWKRLPKATRAIRV